MMGRLIDEDKSKADIIAILEELQTEVEEEAWNQGCIPNYEREDEAYRIRNLIQKKISKLKNGRKNGNDD